MPAAVALVVAAARHAGGGRALLGIPLGAGPLLLVLGALYAGTS